MEEVTYEYGINIEFKDSTTYATNYMRIKSEFYNEGKSKNVENDLKEMIKRFELFNEWLIKCTKITPYPVSKELYGISSKSYKFQTSMALILPALYNKIYYELQKSDTDFDYVINKIQKALKESFLEEPNYTASSTNSREIKKLIDNFML